MSDYAPIACTFHDRLEDWAVRGTPVEVVWHDGEAERAAHDQIADVFARDGADWVRLGDGTTIRANRLVRVGDVAQSLAC